MVVRKTVELNATVWFQLASLPVSGLCSEYQETLQRMCKVSHLITLIDDKNVMFMSN